MASQGHHYTDARAVDWSFPMSNPSHLPPKSPGSFPSLGGDAGAAGRRVGNHKRTPSAGYLPKTTQPTWIEGVVDAPEAGTLTRGALRRSASESMAFLDVGNFAKLVEDNNNNNGNNTEDDDYESRSVASMHSGGHSGAGSIDFDSDHTWAPTPGPAKQQQQQQHVDPATPGSDSNSVASEASNEDLKGGLLPGKYSYNRSDPADVQSSEIIDHDPGGCTQTFSKSELQAALEGLDSSLDPKRAKRILANRQSAQRSRVRKLQYISELERSVTTLQSEVSTMAPKVTFFEHRRAVLNVNNNTIKQKMAALLQGQRFKDAHNEALQKEVQRLRQLYQQRQPHHLQQQEPQVHLQPPNAPAALSSYNSLPGCESSIQAVADMFQTGTEAATRCHRRILVPSGSCTGSTP